jgi:hypothetical protein
VENINDIIIYVEGKIDKVFLSQLISTLGLPESKRIKFEILNGWTNLKTEATINKLREGTFQERLNIVILDADNDFQKRCIEVDEFKNNHKLLFEYFLLPNHKEVGAIESLITNIVESKHQSILTCFSEYKNCLKSRCGNYFLPTSKQEIYALTQTIYGETDIQKIDFLDSINWDTTHQILDSLKKFLLTTCK